MKTKHFISFGIILFGAAVSFLLITNALAQVGSVQSSDIQYPVKELGGCQNETACRAYCDKSENIKPCVAFAEEHNLMSKEEIDMAKKFMAAGAKGPGGCRGKDECDTYCNDINHMDECISFAIENDLMPPEELKEAKQVQAAIKRGVKPPPCGNKKECDTYCDNPNHMEECINFGIEAGFIQGKELEDVQKMLAAVKRGVKPPPCKGKEVCDQYCSEPNNMEVCMNFAMEAGFMPEEEKENAQKMLQAIKKGIKPPLCKGKEECDVYCQEDTHFQECTDFAIAAGFMSEKDAEMARKTGGKGPGGCKGKDECEAFCNNPNNQEICFNFAKEHGLIPEEDLRQMEEGKQKFKESMSQMPPEVADCFKSLVGEEMFEKFKTGTAMPPREIGDQMRQCFEQFKPGPPEGMMPPGKGGICGWCGNSCVKIEPEIVCPTVMPPAGYICIEENGACAAKEGGKEMMPPAGGQGGPGGCKNEEECKTYCESHPEECQDFQPGPGVFNPGGQMMPQQAGPGGCKGPEECEAYCKSNPDQCKNFGSGGEQGQFAPGTGSMKPCEGENCQQQTQMRIEQFKECTGDDCKNLPNTPNMIFKPGTEPIKCEGDNCPPAGTPPTGVNQEGGITPRFIEGQKLPEGQIMAPPGAPMQGTGISPENLPATGFQPPANIISPPTQGNLLPPSGDIAPPTGGNIAPPPATEPPPPSPSGSLELKSFMAQMLNFFFGIQ